jgi:hypothetical protein
MAKSGREDEDTGQFANELERLRAESQRVRRQCDEAVEALRESWKSLGQSRTLGKGLAKRGLAGRKDKSKRRSKLSKSQSDDAAKQ